jgi:hypothetical protein
MLKVHPLAARHGLTVADEILVPPSAVSPPCSEIVTRHVGECAELILKARAHGAGVILMYGAHLLRKGAALILDEMMVRNWLTHLATNGAGTIHDWGIRMARPLDRERSDQRSLGHVRSLERNGPQHSPGAPGWRIAR